MEVALVERLPMLPGFAAHRAHSARQSSAPYLQIQLGDSFTVLWSPGMLLQLPKQSPVLLCISPGTHCSTGNKKTCWESKVCSNNATAHTHTPKGEILINNSAVAAMVSVALLCQAPSVLSLRPFSSRCTYSQPAVFQRLGECNFIHRLNRQQHEEVALTKEDRFS